MLSLCLSLHVIGHIQSIYLSCMVGLYEDRFVRQWHSCVIWTCLKLHGEVGRSAAVYIASLSVHYIWFPLQRTDNYLVYMMHFSYSPK